MTKKGTYHVDHVVLEEIVIVNASIDNSKGLTSLPKGYDYTMSFKVTPGINYSGKRVRMTFDCKIEAFKDKTHQERLDVVGSFELSFTLKVDNLHDLTEIAENGLYDVSEDLLGGLANIAYATSRGIIYTRSLGTILGKIILPVISTPKLLGR